MLSHYQTLTTNAFQIHYMPGEEAFARLARTALAGGLAKVGDYFALSQPFPTVRLALVTERDEFDRLVRDLLRVTIEVPSHPARIAQAQRTDMVAISPSAYARCTPFTYRPEAFGRLLVHELVHMVEEHLSPDIEASPRWWGEGLAVALSDQWRHDPEFRAAVGAVRQGRVPTLGQVTTDPSLAYDWGWTVVRFLEADGGPELINQIVRTCADGGVLALAAADRGCLAAAWRAWVREAVGGVHLKDCRII